MQDGKSRKGDIFLYHKDGTRVPVHVQTYTIKRDGRAVGAIEIFNSLSDIEHLNEEIKRLQKLSFLDHLTMIPNRRYLERAFKIAGDELRRFRARFAIHIIDLVKFKKINDTYGHIYGDMALKQISKAIQRNIRKIDIFGRWGGDEFLLLQKRATRKNMEELAAKLERVVAGSSLPEKPEIKLGITIGSYLVGRIKDLDKALETADQDLYRKKAR
jgi:diguanylate cyclase (GGDEF)-like protein